MKKTRLCDLLGIEYPIIQAPMTWITWADIAAAVSNAGGLGCIGPNAGTTTVTTDVIETGERLRRQIRETRKLTSKPFAIFLATPLPTYAHASQAFSDQCVKVAIEEQIPVALTSGYSPQTYTSQLKAAGIKVVHKGFPSTVEAAKQAEEAGVDAFVAMGYEEIGRAHV